MNREEFHRIYERAPKHFKAELIGGIVFVASALRRRHGNKHLRLGTLFSMYEGVTPGVEAGNNATVLLGDEGEPHPDLYLRVLPDFGGQSATSADDYVVGAPELVAEVAYSSRSIDLHAKRADYARYGVLEYLVLSISESRLRWFDLRADQELSADPDDVIRVRCFPGLWIQVDALLAGDFQRSMDTLQMGVAAAEHSSFVQRLAAGRAARGNSP